MDNYDSLKAQKDAIEKKQYKDFAVFGVGFAGTYNSRATALATLENNKNQGEIYIKLAYAEKMAQTIRRVINACDEEHLSATLPPGLRRELGECLDDLK